jgi:hypothetical protein
LATLLRIMVAQQLSTKSPAAIWGRPEATRRLARSQPEREVEQRLEVERDDQHRPTVRAA